ncbi:MAG TPA: radical SAM protein [Candidatus Solibacter sp.]|nr:radical SAM protein [Candidatus Solibacter sp.]
MSSPTLSNKRDAFYRRIYMGVNYKLRTAADGRLAGYCRPTDIGFMMTNLCNAKCVHCDIWKNKGKDDVPTPEQYKTVLTDMRRWLGPVHVFFSGGEALLQKYVPDLLAHANRVGLWAEILTHGYWNDQAPIEKVALANPGRVTVSLDGVGEAHTVVRGRENFFEKTSRSLETLKRIRAEKNLGFVIRLKTVIMRQNLHDVHNVAEFAANNGFEVFYQAVEQNYNTPEDPRWFETSENWPRDPEMAIQAVRRLIELKRKGLPIRNSFHQLEAMIPYFLNPDAMRVAMQSHTAHQKKPICSATTNIEILPNGDVLSCYGMPPIGNIKNTPIREIWEKRPQWWNGGCCMERRCTQAEKENLKLTTIST